MRPTLSILVALFLGFAVGACIKASMTERRVVELPAGQALADAEKICRGLIASGYGADIQRKFPAVTAQQLQGLFLTWNEGTFSQSGHSVFIMCGINYSGSLPQAKELADYCQSVVKKAVADKFPSAK